LSQTLFEGSDSLPIGTAQVPFRWLDPVAAKDGLFRKTTDTWSFGVCVWEILSRSRPYEQESDARKVATELTASGYRLERPDVTAMPVVRATSEVVDQLYLLMLECWDSDLERRPSMADAAKQLQEYLKLVQSDPENNYSVEERDTAMPATPTSTHETGYSAMYAPLALGSQGSDYGSL
jgi:serine/threonine protein kinase